MYCMAAIRPASMVCALIHAPCKAWRPKSPNTTRLPRCALPLIRPLWFFRCFTRLGISAIGTLLIVHALIHPHLHADVPLRRGSLGEAVIDLRPQRAQRQRTNSDFFATRHFSAAQAA